MTAEPVETSPASSAVAVQRGISSKFLLLIAMSVAAFAWLAVDDNAPRWATFVAVSVSWITAVCLHEFGHAVVAYFGGDITVARKGYLSIDPTRFVHPFWSLAMPLAIAAVGGIGLPGAAVFINQGLLRSRLWRSATALAGPLASFIIFVALALPFALGLGDAAPSRFWDALALLAFLQLTAAIFNLLPIPGLDGFNAIAPYLPKDVAGLLYRTGSIIIVTFIYLMMSNGSFSSGLFHAVFQVAQVFGLPPLRVAHGIQAFQFWKA